MKLIKNLINIKYNSKNRSIPTLQPFLLPTAHSVPFSYSGSCFLLEENLRCQPLNNTSLSPHLCLGVAMPSVLSLSNSTRHSGTSLLCFSGPGELLCWSPYLCSRKGSCHLAEGSEATPACWFNARFCKLLLTGAPYMWLSLTSS